MHLVRIFIAGLLLGQASSVFAQHSSALQKRIDVYFEAMEKPDFDLVLSMTYPKVFELAPRPSMKKLLESSFQNPEIEIRIDSTTSDSIHRALLHNGGQYIKVDYSFLMIMKFKADSTGPVLVTRALPTMKKKYGAENTRINPVTNELVIKRTSTLAAIKNTASKDWTFIELKKDDPLSAKLLGKELLTKLEQY